MPARTAGAWLRRASLLLAAVLADPRLVAVAALPRRELLDLPDPRPAVLERAVARGRAVRVTIEE